MGKQLSTYALSNLFFLCWKICYLMRPSDNHRPYVLHRVVSSEAFRPHNCPNCNCGPCSVTNNHVISRPTSPNYYRQVVTPTINLPKNIVYNSSNQIARRVPEQRIFASPKNLYYQRTDLHSPNKSIHSNRSVSSNHSISNDQRISAVGGLPSQNRILGNPSVVHIRYMSPSPASHHTKHQNNRLVQQIRRESVQKIGQLKDIRPVCFENVNKNIPIPNSLLKNAIQRVEKEDAQELPRIPSILSKKASQSKKSKMQQGSSGSRTEMRVQAQLPSNQKDIGTLSAIMSRKAIKSSHWPSSEKIHWQPSASDIILQQQEQKLLASQISKDLKLNFDYFQTQDMSKIESGNGQNK